MLKKYIKPYIKWFILGLTLVFILGIGVYLHTQNVTPNTTNEQTTENIEYQYCDEIMLFYPDGNYEYVYLNYDVKTIQYDTDNTIVKYLIKESKGLGLGGRIVAYISNGVLYFKDTNDYYNDDTTYNIFSGTFYVDTLK